eukprot:1039015-Prymnesium_polylepis.1
MTTATPAGTARSLVRSTRRSSCSSRQLCTTAKCAASPNPLSCGRVQTASTQKCLYRAPRCRSSPLEHEIHPWCP